VFKAPPVAVRKKISCIRDAPIRRSSCPMPGMRALGVRRIQMDGTTGWTSWTESYAGEFLESTPAELHMSVTQKNERHRPHDAAICDRAGALGGDRESNKKRRRKNIKRTRSPPRVLDLELGEVQFLIGKKILRPAFGEVELEN